MDTSQKLVCFLINILIFVEICKAGRSFGGRTSSRSRPSSSWGSRSRPSPSYPSPSWSSSHPSPSRPSWGSSPSYPSPSRSWGSSAVHPSPSRSWGSSANHPSPSHSSAPNYGWNPPAAKPAPIITHPNPGVGIDRTQIKPTQTGVHTASSSVGWNVNSKPQQPSAPPLEKTNANPSQNHPNPTSLSYPPSYGFKPNAPPAEKTNMGTGVNSGNIGWNLPPAPRSGGLPPKPVGPPLHNSPNNNHPGMYQPGGYHPGGGYSPGGYNPGGYHPGGYNPGGYHQPGNYFNPDGNTKVKIVNKNYYYSPGHYSLPQPHYQYPGYYYSPTSYHYSSSDVGSGALGFFLGYSLAKMTTPTFGHYSFYDGYRPRYDHYSVHHYYHNKETVPTNPVVPSNSIIGCVGDSSSICPQNTISLCTSNGNIMCVASVVTTAPCSDNPQLNCIKTEVPCVNAGNCTNPSANTTSVSIPCISTAKVVGEIQTVNNTIVGNNPNATVPFNNTSAIPTTIAPITTTLVSQNSTNATVVARKRRQVGTQNFCVTIVAMPANKETTEGEKVYSESKSLFTKFFEKAWGLS